MRIVFLIPDLRRDVMSRARIWLAERGWWAGLDWKRILWATGVYGGTLNIMRQCALVRALGIDAVLASERGIDTYGPLGIGQLPFVAWERRRRDDICIVPDVFSRLVDTVAGQVVVYLQAPIQIRSNFDHLRSNLEIWTCSPLVTEHCRRLLPGKEPLQVPNIVDPRDFPFIEQEHREPGRLVALPRKNAGPFIAAVQRCYRRAGGRYWKLDLIDGVPFSQFAERYRTPQALLTASSLEGCGLPGMEAMAAGIAVAGRNGGGGSFYMRDGHTALVANDPEGAAQALLRLEDHGLRRRLCTAAYEAIRPFFPAAQPTRFWKDWLAARR